VHVWEHITDILFSLLDRYDDQMVFVLILLEEAGVPLPLPGDLIMIMAGLRIADGRMSLVPTLLLLELATLLGASLLYWLAARGGRPLLQRYGRYIHLDHIKLGRAERWMLKHGVLAIVAGRFIPGLRIPTVIVAGVFGIRYPIFLSGLACGSFLYIAFWVGIGYIFGPQALAVVHSVQLPLRALLSLVLFVALGAFLGVMYRRSGRVRRLPRVPAGEPRRLEMTIQAGLVATLGMGLGTNAILYGLSALGIHEAERAITVMFATGASRFYDGDVFNFSIALTAILFASGIVWAIVYTHVVEPLLPWPAWLSGLASSLLPLLVSLTILLPLFGGGWLGLGLGGGLFPLTGEVVRNAMFGLGLGTSYALLYAARQPPARAVASGGVRSEVEDQAPAAAEAALPPI
jgi:membrane protein DedA with SNARE-associated domain